jgi:hypothetical protein
MYNQHARSASVAGGWVLVLERVFTAFHISGLFFAAWDGSAAAVVG